MKTYLELLVILMALNSVRTDCQFRADEVKNETRLVAIKRNGKLEILNEDRVAAGTKLDFICSDQPTIKVTCNRNGMFSGTLPIKNCNKTPAAIVKPVPNSSCKYNAYAIGYQVDNSFLVIYESCFNNITENVIMSSHIAYPYSIVTGRPTAGFTRDAIVSSLVATSYQAKSVYAAFNQILGNSQKYVENENDVIINRGHLTPSADFLYPINMRATFKYVNMVPMFSSINRGNWKSVENWVRRYISRTGKAHVTTGVFKTLNLLDEHGDWRDMYLDRGAYNAIPKWIYKIVENVAGDYVFLAYNNNKADVRPMADCVEVACPIQFPNDKKSGFIYCCEPISFKLQVISNSQ